MRIKFILSQEEDRGSLSLFYKGKNHVLTSENRGFQEAVALVTKGELSKKDLTALESILYPKKSVQRVVNALQSSFNLRFDEAEEAIYYRDERLTGALVDKIISLRRRKKGYMPLLRFLSNLLENPSPFSRKQLYSYLEKHKFPITQDGHFLAYKATQSDGTSHRTGDGYVDGVYYGKEARLPHRVGATLWVDRENVQSDPYSACGYGLHAGALNYVKTFAAPNSKLWLVKINPKDVVSVPVDSDHSKLRTCRYTVLAEIKANRNEVRELDKEVVALTEELIKDGYANKAKTGQEPENVVYGLLLSLVSRYDSPKAVISEVALRGFKNELSQKLKNPAQGARWLKRILQGSAESKVYVYHILHALHQLAKEYDEDLNHYTVQALARAGKHKIKERFLRIAHPAG